MKKFAENITYKATCDKYTQMAKNTVDSKNQLAERPRVHLLNPEDKGLRIMFVGNSITLHGKKPDIGWNNEWGMAASSKDNDYVHILIKRIKETLPDSQFCICQVAEWERNYKNGKSSYYRIEGARDFDADIIITRFIENCPKSEFDADVFKKEYADLLDYLNKSQKAKFIITTGFWKHPGDAMIMEYAKENGLTCIYMGDLGELDEMKAVGLFEHLGVASHPGDLGMKNIADRIFNALKNLL